MSLLSRVGAVIVWGIVSGIVSCIAAWLAASLVAVPSAAGADMPGSVAELWADFDPRRDPLEVEVIREWREGGGVFRHVRYLVGTFKGRPARMTAIYGFPADAPGKLPAVMHIHGGGQRGSLVEVKLLVARGYAGLSVNWGGRGRSEGPAHAVEGAADGDPNTDWGAVDPTQCNVQGYATLEPGPLQFYDDRAHPKNNNWYLLTQGCRRGLTFLERQPEVDAARLGVHGYSMGGNLTMYVAGTDDRVRAAVPAVGGQGWRWEPHVFTGGTAAPQDRVSGDIETFRRTLSFESYAPLIRCPVLHRSATNDFHGLMDDVYRTNALIRGQPVRCSWTPHVNHRLAPETEIGMLLWFDHFLKGGPALPESPMASLALRAEHGQPAVRVRPDSRWPVDGCAVYYSVDSDPRARYWRSADVVREGGDFVASLPLSAGDAPLFAFANVHHVLPEPQSLAELPGHGEPVRHLCLTSDLLAASAAAVAAAGVSLAPPPGPVIDDFSRGWRDWYRFNVGNHVHWQHWTRKITDPAWRGPDGAALVVTLTMPRTNRITFVAVENEWRGYRGRRRTFTCTREIPGTPEPQAVAILPADFVSTEPPAAGKPAVKDDTLASWQEIDLLGICGHFAEERPARPAAFDGPAPEFHRVEWRPGASSQTR